MSHIDLFNGDADGIFALIQLRKANPVASTLVSGVKRDIALLDKIVPATGDDITVLDVSAAKNRDGLERALAAGAKVRYFDHHQAGELPNHPNLESHINGGKAWCTSLLVDRYLNHLYTPWALAGGFGDNLHQFVRDIGRRHGLTDAQLAQLQRLGELVNYNGYGITLADLCFEPTELYRLLYRYDDPFVAAAGPELAQIEQCYRQDQQQAQALQPYRLNRSSRVYLLPDQPWARRLSGTLANQLQQQFPTEAIAMLLSRPDGYQVSVRVPSGFRINAEQFCAGFDSGGGRALAAGINHLAEPQLERFMTQFSQLVVRD